LSLKNLPALTFLFALSLFGSPLRADEINIYFKASPRLELLHPYSDPATLTLLVTGADGKPVAQGWVAIRLDAPEPGWFSTDFPLVEGSRLLEMRLPVRQGRAEWKYLFPIRGQYRLTVEYTAFDGKKAVRTFALGIREDKQKWFFLAIFSLLLFAVGAVAGRIFTGPRSGPAGLVVLVAGLIAATGAAEAQEAERGGQFGWLEVDPAVVGKLTKVRWRLAGEADTEARPVLLTLTIAHLEKGKTVFSVERLPVEKEFAMDFQFTDGTEHRVSAIAYMSGGRMLRTEQNVSVTAIEPPARAVIPAIGFFLAVIALGLGVGRWSRRQVRS
jgi:hypothetical protein